MTITIVIEIFVNGEDASVEAEIEYTCGRETPATHTDPGAPCEIEIISIRIAPFPSTTHTPWLVECPAWLYAKIASRLDHEEMAREANYGRPYRDPDAAYEAWRDA